MIQYYIVHVHTYSIYWKELNINDMLYTGELRNSQSVQVYMVLLPSVGDCGLQLGVFYSYCTYIQGTIHVSMKLVLSNDFGI